MKNFFHFSLIFMLMSLLVSCTSPQENLSSQDNEGLALNVLENFLGSLNKGNYVEAARLYGGTYETMIGHNPAIDPADYPALLENACTVNGAQCLQVKSAELNKKVSDMEFIFKVGFLNADGTPFVIGPCCGGGETDSPSQSAFYFTVKKVNQDKFVVIDMPPYAP